MADPLVISRAISFDFEIIAIWQVESSMCFCCCADSWFRLSNVPVGPCWESLLFLPHGCDLRGNFSGTGPIGVAVGYVEEYIWFCNSWIREYVRVLVQSLYPLLGFAVCLHEAVAMILFVLSAESISTALHGLASAEPHPTPLMASLEKCFIHLLDTSMSSLSATR